ncbi:MAG TPA: NUDIX domain-containing protein [Thermomicrobiales bacterium]|nr:NUDIX domain-containing protein [Thermomicrobiales bacterium]
MADGAAAITYLGARARAVIVRRGHVLAGAYRERDGAVFHALMGGGIEPGESGAACLAREFREETGLALAVGRLVYVNENFFLLDGRPHHEIGLFYAATLATPTADLAPVAMLEPDTVVPAWLDLGGPLDTLYPAFLRETLPRDAAAGFARPIAHVHQFDTDPAHSHYVIDYAGAGQLPRPR